MENPIDTAGAALDYIKSNLHKMEGSEQKQIAAILMEEIFGLSRLDLLTNPDQRIDQSRLIAFKESVEKIMQGEPLAYVLGSWQFYGLPFRVNPSVLIPRPETEELVQWILSENQSGNLLDVGTGSGCIPIALKKQNPAFEVGACDVSESALAVAKQNAEMNQVDIRFFQIDIRYTETLNNAYDVIVSNPPYIPSSEKEQLDASVLDHEPPLALFVHDEDPLLFYRKIAQLGLNNLKAGGKLYFEIHHAYGAELLALLNALGYVQVELLKDINGKDRMLRGVKSDQVL